MKKLLLSVAAAFLSAASYGQFFTSTTYRGAFGVGAGANWMSGWTEFNPRNATYPGTGEPVTGLQGKTRVDVGGSPFVSNGPSNTYILQPSELNWTADKVYYLNGPIVVAAGSTLNIAAGTYVRGTNPASGLSYLCISRGAKLNANGTSTNPVVMTSDQTKGNRNSGDWGGLLLCGNAPININRPDISTVGERNFEASSTVDATRYGNATSPNPADNSGNMQYLRVEFAGDATIVNQEFNGVMLAGVGTGTTFDNVMVSYSKDDSFEWFGGTVNCKHLVALGGTDDDWDVDEGYSGKIQFGFSLRDPRFYDISGNDASNIFEMDDNTTSGGVGTSSIVGYSPTPVTSVTFSNMTCIGPVRDGESAASVSPRFAWGFNCRTNPATAVFNSIIMGTKNSILRSSTTTLTGLSTGPANWQKWSCDSIVARNTAFLQGTGNSATVLATVGGLNGTTADCQNAFATKTATDLLNFVSKPAYNNTISVSALTSANLGMVQPAYSGSIAGITDANYGFGGGSVDMTAVNPVLTAGSPYASGADFSNPRLGIASRSDLTISSTLSSYGSYKNVTITSTGVATLSGNIDVTGTLTVQSGGTLIMAGNAITGTGNVVFAAGSIIKTSAASGFANSITGAIRNSGTKSLSTDANYTFNGTVAQSTGGFWTGGRDVTISNTAGVTLSSAATVGGILALSSGTFTAGNNLLTIGSNSGRQGIIDDFTSGYTGTLSATSIYFKRYAGSGSLTSVAPPVISNANTINSVVVPAGPTCAGVKEFDEFSNSWIPVDNGGGACTDPMVNVPAVLAGNSLLAFGYREKTYTYSGLPQTGNQVRAITRSAGTVPPAAFVAKGWNSISNPYAAPITWSSFAGISGNTAQSNCIAYVWNSAISNYGTISAAGVTTNGANNTIAPGQGILIRRSAVGSGNVTFAPSMRVSTSSQTYVRESAPALAQEIRLNLKGSESADEIMISSGDLAMNVDKFFSPAANAVSMFIPNGQEPLTALVAELKENVIPVSIQVPANGSYSISASSIKGLPSNVKVIIEDKTTNRFQELTEGSVYNFHAQSTDAARFALHIQSSSATTSVMGENALIYASGNVATVRVSNVANTTSTVIISDLTGKKVSQSTFEGDSFSTVVNAPAGIYTVTVKNGSLVKTQKVIVGSN
jgi:hypothetical protein